MKIITVRQLREEVDQALWEQEVSPRRRRWRTEMVFRIKIWLRLDRGGIAW